MKSKIHYILFSIIVFTTAFSFANEKREEKNYKNYITLGGLIADSGDSHTALPQITFGRRYKANHDAVDVSIVVASGEKNDSRREYYSYPKARYLHYLDGCCFSGFYLGGGLSWSTVRHKEDNQSFTGVFTEACLGYEFDFDNSLIQMVEFSISQPTFATKRKGSRPGPTVALSWGIGF